jgi:hypothetical protein
MVRVVRVRCGVGKAFAAYRACLSAAGAASARTRQPTKFTRGGQRKTFQTEEA